MQKKNAIFIAATGQNVGKTTICLGIIAALRKRFSSVGFIKPVGQHHVPVGHQNVDKDAVLFKEHFALQEEYTVMSPVIIPPGFTRRFLNAEESEISLLNSIRSAFHTVSINNPYTVVEGTGHTGVGSIINLSNARIASELGLEMVIVASAGLGSTFDELALNISLCHQFGVKIRGIILNRVLENKKEMIEEYFPKTLQKWDIPIIGLVPFNSFLSRPTMKDFETLFNTNLLAGNAHHYRSFEHLRLVAGSLEAFDQETNVNELIITPASREDIIFRVLEKNGNRKDNYQGGLILTSSVPPSQKAIDLIKSVDIPVLYSPICSYDAMKMITSFITKIRKEDTPKIEKAIQLIEENVNIDAIC